MPETRKWPDSSYFSMTRSNGAIAELDGLRAIAILLVLARHAVRPFFNPAAPLLPVGTWDAAIPMINGWMGVDLFFVLSGFLITTQIGNRYNGLIDRSGFADYMKRRVLRIIPAYYFMLFVAGLGLIPLYPVAQGMLGFRLTYHMLFLQDYLPSNIIVAFWSLGVEEKFYLIAPFVLIAIFRLKNAWAQYAALATLALLPALFRSLTMIRHPGVTTYEAYFHLFRSPFHLSFDGLCIGSLCALIFRDRQKLGRTGSKVCAHSLFWGGAALILWLSSSTVLLNNIGWFQKVPLQSLLALGMGGMLMGLVLGGGPAGWFRAKWLLIIARLSYALYLVHLTVAPMAEYILGQWVDRSHVSMGGQFLIFLPLFLGLSFGAALLLHYGIEKPFLLIKDQLPQKRTRAMA
jgi:peptidoglycan/LPS O-acetylase OafA/YrhL